MKTYQVRVTQELKGYYEGMLEIEAPTKTIAKKILRGMSLEEIDQQTDWTQGDDYDGDPNTIHIEGDLELLI